jgi:membrane protein required for colicin V production
MILNPIDLLVIVLAGFFLIIDGIRGFLKSISLLAGIVLGFWLAGHYAGLVAAFLEPTLSFPFSYIMAFILTFLASTAAVQLGSAIVKFIFRAQILRWADHLLGGILGAAKGVVLAALILVVFNFFHPLPQEIKKNSYSYYYLAKISQWMVVKLPQKLSLKSIRSQRR